MIYPTKMLVFQTSYRCQVLERLLNNELDGEEADNDLILVAMPTFVWR